MSGGMIIVKEAEDSDDDILEILRIKPIPGLTKKRALEIKDMILKKEENLYESPVKSSENEDASETKEKSKKRKFEYCESDVMVLSENILNSHREENDEVNEVEIISMGTADPQTSSSICSPTECSTVMDCETSKTLISSINEEMALSDDVERTKNIQSGNESSVKEKETEDVNVWRRKVSNDGQVPSSANTSFPQDESKSFPKSENDTNKVDSSYYYSQSLKKIVCHVLSNQVELEQKTVEKGHVFSKLFLKEEYDCFEKLFKFPDKASKLFARMLCRKKGWHRMSAINYPDICDNIESVFAILKKHNFVDYDIENETMEKQLGLLNKPEIQKVCKAFNISVVGGATKKQDYIDSIIKSSKNQRSVVEMWKKDNESTRLSLLKSYIIKTLGNCVRLNTSTLETFNRLMLLFSLSHSVNIEDKWSSQIQMVTQVLNNRVQYPSYVVQPTVVFDVRDDFLSYEKAEKLMLSLNTAMENKSYSDIFSIGQKAKKKFIKALGNETFLRRVMDQPSFLRKYSSGTLYARMLGWYCKKYKKNKDPEEIIEIMNILVNQNIFLTNKKGQWYTLLAQTYESQNKPVEAASTLVRALKDELINEVDRLKLQTRGISLLRKKTNRLEDDQLREELKILCANEISEPPKIEISGKAVPGNEPGFKCVYVNDFIDGRIYSSVEERAINHYKANGFTEGIHSEGFIVHTIFSLVFFDIIYGKCPAGAFQSPYQDAPLDFFSNSFYINRRDVIHRRLKEMRSWSIEEFEQKITKPYSENFGTCCTVTWNEKFTPKILCEIVQCMGLKQIACICGRLIGNFKIYRSGFPDLTLWNPATQKCKLVEVKSPSDKLSANQRLWLDYLSRIGLDCEVCNVKNTASKKRKSV